MRTLVSVSGVSLSMPSPVKRQSSTPSASSENKAKFVPHPSQVAPRGYGAPGQIRNRLLRLAPRHVPPSNLWQVRLLVQRSPAALPPKAISAAEAGPRGRPGPGGGRRDRGGAGPAGQTAAAAPASASA